MTSSVKLLSSSKCFGGMQRIYSHISQVLDCEMKFGVYVPPAALDDPSKAPLSTAAADIPVQQEHQRCPVLYFLSGLASTHERFIKNAGVQKHAARHGIIVVTPDTSPRNVATLLPEQADPFDHGEGAGFYIDATEEPWSHHYHMFTYVTKELIAVVESQLPVVAADRRGICGFSMGGHGALICALRHPELYRSVSVFAPVANPSATVWGRHMLLGYVGASEAKWAQWDASRLIAAYSGCTPLELFIDQGSCDEFLEGHLQTEKLMEAASQNPLVHVIFKERQGYDHTYYYVRTFIEEHLDYHAALLNDN